MEIMYHNTLKTGPLRDLWHQTFPEMYDFLKQSSSPVFDLSGVGGFAPNVTDYSASVHLSYIPNWDDVLEYDAYENGAFIPR